MLDEHFNEEEIQDYDCKTCNSRTVAKLHTEVKNLNELFIVSFKLFEKNGKKKDKLKVLLNDTISINQIKYNLIGLI